MCETHLGAFRYVVPCDEDGKRLDVFIAEVTDGVTRSLAGSLIRSGAIRVGDTARKASYKVRTGDVVSGSLPEPEPSPLTAEDIPLAVLFEDRHMIVVNKPAGLVVHPAPGHPGGTLVNALLHHCPDLAGIGGQMRPGIVHRLDKDTSGVMVVAKHQKAHDALSAMFHDRETDKRYIALVYGNPEAARGQVDTPIGRHPKDRKRMSVTSRHPRTALSLWEQVVAGEGVSRLAVQIKTGRTHQIRVHLSSIGFPIIGDPVYGARRPERYVKDRGLAGRLQKISRQMLHAHSLCFSHPVTGTPLSFTADPPSDMHFWMTELGLSDTD